MQAVAKSGAGFSGASAIHMNIFGLHPVVVFGTDEQKRAVSAAADRRQGKDLLCGNRARCRARHDAAQDAGGARRRPLRLVGPQDLDLDRPGRREDADPGAHDAVRGGRAALAGHDACSTPISTAAPSRCARSRRWAARRSTSNLLFIDGLKVPAADRIGEEGKGFHYILHGMNPERILIAAEAVGLGRAALDRAARYAERARRLRPADRPEPGDPAPARRALDRARSGRADGVARRRRL